MATAKKPSPPLGIVTVIALEKCYHGSKVRRAGDRFVYKGDVKNIPNYLQVDGDIAEVEEQEQAE